MKSVDCVSPIFIFYDDELVDKSGGVWYNNIRLDMFVCMTREDCV